VREYLLRRVPSAVVVLFVASVFIFALLRLVPGDPAAELAGSSATPAAIAHIRAELGLGQPLVSQYLTWIGHMATLNLGRSYVLGGSVGSLISAGLANTAVLALSALALAVVVALATSVAAVVLDRRWLNHLITAGGTFGIGIPTFVTGTAFVLIFAVEISLLPAGGTPPNGFGDLSQTLRYVVLPAVTLAVPMAAVLIRFLTESLRSQMRQPYVTTARALGISRTRIVLTQALRNALPTTITVLGIQFGALLGGTVLVESIFAWPGLGHLLEQAVLNRDYPVIQAMLMLAVSLFVLTQLATDLINTWLDPRIRLGGAP
jgi:peptide/nickel transport system permease protein